jgi:MotA/TolQ/ExbB proton channel family
MFVEYFEVGGTVMYALFGVWVIVLAGMLDRAMYLLGRVFRRPVARVITLARADQLVEATSLWRKETLRQDAGLQRIDSVSQLATSLGLFGTVLGLARAFFSNDTELGLAAPEVLAKGLSTALYTTVAGLIIFLTGQSFLIGFRLCTEVSERRLAQSFDVGEGPER